MYIFNETKYKISNYSNKFKFIYKITEKLLNYKFDFNVIFVNKTFIKKLNYKYLNKNKVTDVLAFKYYDNALKNNKTYLGDIFICYEYSLSRHHINNFDEILFLVIHGILHLNNYDHKMQKDKITMFKLQNKIIKQYQKIYK